MLLKAAHTTTEAEFDDVVKTNLYSAFTAGRGVGWWFVAVVGGAFFPPSVPPSLLLL